MNSIPRGGFVTSHQCWGQRPDRENLRPRKTEKTIEETHTLSVDFELALKKIYGTPLPGEVVDIEVKPIESLVKEEQ